MISLDRRTLIRTGTAAAALWKGAAPLAAKASSYGSFRPGAVWLDTAGKPIRVRGGSIIQIDGAFYWYGENKERTTGKDRIWHWGVRCYRSTDLYNWEDAGI